MCYSDYYIIHSAIHSIKSISEVLAKYHQPAPLVRVSDLN